MVGQSKILTVSYGTFSCTLEGFDDSFSTMKAIAEYFRDLASDDRYFGAEPPTPDADMLARIAEREIERRVDAHTDGSDIVLRATAALGAPAEPAQEEATAEAPAVEQQQDMQSGEDVAAQATAAQAEAEAEAIAQATAAQAEAEAEAEAIAQATAAQAEAEAIAQADAEHAALVKAEREAKAVAEREAAELAAKAQADAATEAAAQAKAAQEADPIELAPAAAAADADPVSEADVEDDLDLSSVLVTEVSETEETPEADAAEDAPAPSEGNSIAAKLRRIRAVVGRGGDTNGFTEDQHAEELSAPIEDPAAEESDVLAAVTGALLDDAPVDTFEEDEAAVAETPAAFLDMEADSAETGEEDTSFEDSVSAALAEEDAIAADVQDDPIVSAPVQPRVIKMRRSEFERAVEEGRLAELNAKEDANVTSELADLDGLEELELDTKAEAEGSLSAEDEADLMQELAEVEAEVEATTSENAPSKRAQLEAEGEPNASAERILSETNAQLDDPEGSRRRQAIAQLKAAVAATEAARQMGEKEEEDGEVENAFREDLSRVVRPNRPQKDTQTERPRPAPLKLVASQRVDAPIVEEDASQTEAPIAPVRPRRVSVQPAAVSAPAEEGSFADYAASVGATELPDLLEAAAAYTSFIEGREQFSRPQIIRKIREVSDGAFSREDGLRGFGTLLRLGRIAKIKGGQFQITDQTRFRPQNRAAG